MKSQEDPNPPKYVAGVGWMLYADMPFTYDGKHPGLYHQGTFASYMGWLLTKLATHTLPEEHRRILAAELSLARVRLVVAAPKES